MTDLTFKPASRLAVKARIALIGPSGCGKTWTGLEMANALAGGNRFAVIDTERESASLYADDFTFDALNLSPPFSPERYIAAIHAAEQAGYPVILIDSLSHAWFDEGGVLDIVDKAAAALHSNNTFAAWAKGTPQQNALMNAVMRSSIHVIATMRAKTEYAMSTVNGQTTVRKLGMGAIQRSGVEHEFDIVGEMDLDHRVIVTKSRFKSLQDASVVKPGKDFAGKIVAELQSGEAPSLAETSTSSDGQTAGDVVSGEASPPSEPLDEEAPDFVFTKGDKAGQKCSDVAASDPEWLRSIATNPKLFTNEERRRIAYYWLDYYTPSHAQET